MSRAAAVARPGRPVAPCPAVRDIHVLEYIRHPETVWCLPGAYVDGLRGEFPGVTFSAPADQAEADRLIPGADVVLGWAVTRGNFASASKLKWVQITAAGVGDLLFPQLVESPVVVTNGRGLHAIAMAEHTLGVILSFARKLHLARDAQAARRWDQPRLWGAVPGIGELAGGTLGLVGLGSVGKAIAERARVLGLRVIALRRHPDREPAPVDEQWGPGELPRLIEQSDWLVLAAPLTRETRGLIGARELERARPGAVLINLGRGALVDESALVAALQSGRIAGAALDVFEREPLPSESPLWDMPQVIVTPHISGLGPRYWERAIDLFRGNLCRFLSGEPLTNVVDKREGY